MRKDKQKTLDYGREYREKNKEVLRKKAKDRYVKRRSTLNGIEKEREYQKEYYNDNKNTYSEYRRKKWQKIKTDPDLYNKSREQYRKWANTAGGIYTSIKNRGRKDFSLDKDSFISWYNGRDKICDYCSMTLEDIRTLPYPYNRKNGLTKLSIDRMDNTKGYSLDNITLSCFMCNTIKNNFLTYDDMKKIGRTIIGPKLKKLLK